VSETLARLGRMLVARGVLSEEMLAAELVNAPASASRFLSRLLLAGHALEGELVAVLAERYGQPGVDLATSAFLLDVLDLIPRAVAEGDLILALSTEGGRLHVAVTSPNDAQGSIDEVRFITGLEVSLYVAIAGPLERAIAAAYDLREHGGTVWRGAELLEGAALGLTIVQPVGALTTPPSGMRLSELQGLQDEAVAHDEAAGVHPGPEELEIEISSELSDGAEEEVLEGEIVETGPVEEDLGPSGSESGQLDLEGAATPLNEPRKPAHEIDIEIGAVGDDEEELEIVGSVRVGPKRILVVDDEPDIIKLCTRAFTVKGWLVDSAADGAEAEKKLAKGDPPDLVLLDAMLPQVHGFEICQRIKANKALRGVQVMMMSAVYRGWRFAQDARETYGADDYIEKPFHLADLLRRVEERLLHGEDVKRKTIPGKREGERFYKLAMEAFNAGKLTEARNLLEGAAREDPFSPRVYFSLARTLAAQGDVYRAISAYERSVELRPNLFPALKNLAALYVEKGFRRKAAETLERALQAAPDPATREQVRTQLLRLL
jgi:CheY-like chemotaxis protein